MNDIVWTHKCINDKCNTLLKFDPKEKIKICHRCKSDVREINNCPTGLKGEK